MVKATNKLVSSEVEFEKLKPIGNGQGRNSNVYKIKDSQLNAIRVAKEIKTSSFSDVSEYFSEAEKMHNVAHPNVIPVHFAGTGSDNSISYVYIVMDYCPTGSLESLHEKKLLTVEEIVRFALQFLTGLAYIHSKGIVHFDIKPSNILIKKDGVAAITDFGIAKWLKSSDAVAPSKVYGPHVTPEVINTGTQTELSDIYNVGLTLYRLCNELDEWDQQLRIAHNKPQRSFEHEVINGKFPDRNTFLPHIPKKLREIISNAIQINPDNRYNSVREMMNEISTVKRYLQWQMKIDGSDTGHEEWVMSDKKGRSFRVQILEDGNTWSVETTKTVKTTQNINACCVENLTTHNNALKRVQTFIRSKDIGVL